MVEHGRRATDHLSLPMVPQSAPWWVQVGLIVLFWLGPAAIVATFFMLLWAGAIDSPITRTEQAATRIEIALSGSITRMQSEVANNRQSDEHIVRLLLATCRNVARTDLDRAQCDNYWRR